MKKAALFAFNGEVMCFVHVLLNAVDMKKNGYDVQIVMEGSATRLMAHFQNNRDEPFAKLYFQVLEQGLIGCACRACSAKMGALDAATAQGIPLRDELNGHPSIRAFLDEGYQVFTF